jgi:hypothetical protein
MKKYLLKFILLTFIVVLSACGGGAGNSSDSNNSNSNTALTASLLDPVHEAQDTSTIPVIQIKFSAPAANVNHQSVTLHKNNVNGAVVEIDSVTQSDNNIYTFAPKSLLDANTTYYIVLSNAIAGVDGNVFGGSVFKFTTGKLSTPEVNLLSPANGATKVTTSPSIQVKFSTSVNNVNNTTITLHQGSPDGNLVAISSIIQGDNNIYTFSPVANLREATKYYVVISHDIVDNNGNHLSPENFSFTTDSNNVEPVNPVNPVNPISGPTVQMISPSDNNDNVSLNPNIELKFSKAVKNVNTGNIILQKCTDTICNNVSDKIEIGAITAGDGNTYTFSPVTELKEATNYNVTVSNGVTDDSGNTLTTTKFHFTTGKYSAPTVTMINPGNNADRISLKSSIEIKFSEAVQNVDNSTIKLSRLNKSGQESDVIIKNISLNADNTYLIKPESDFINQATYKLTLSNKITDKSGNALDVREQPFTFTTASIVYVIGENSNTAIVSSCVVSADNELTNCTSRNLGKTPYQNGSIAINHSQTAAYITLHQNTAKIVSVCQINSDGSLSSSCIDQSLPDTFRLPSNSSINPDDSFLYILGDSEILKCSINQSNYTINTCTTALNTGGTAITFNKDGKSAYISTNSNINQCAVDTSGDLINCVSKLVVGNVRAINYTKDQSSVYLTKENGQILLAEVNNFNNNMLAANLGASLFGMAINNDYSIAYITNTQANNVQKCAIDPETELFSCKQSGSTFNSPTSIAMRI